MARYTPSGTGGGGGFEVTGTPDSDKLVGYDGSNPAWVDNPGLEVYGPVGAVGRIVSSDGTNAIWADNPGLVVDGSPAVDQIVSYNGGEAVWISLPPLFAVSGAPATGQVVTFDGTEPSWADTFSVEGIPGLTKIVGYNGEDPVWVEKDVPFSVSGVPALASVIRYDGAQAAWSPLLVVGFKATYYVDPSFTGTQLGSESNPFTTIAAAFASALANAITKGIVLLAPGSNCIENVTFPATGEWEIASLPTQGATGNVTITGNVDSTVTGSARRALRGISLTGNITGSCSAGTHRLFVKACTINGTTTLTQTGAGVNRLGFGGDSGEAFSGVGLASTFFVGAVSVAGTVGGSGTTFIASLAISQTSCLQNCLLPSTTSVLGAGGVTLYLFNCANANGGALAFAGGAGYMVLRPDGVTISELMRVSTVLTGNVQLKAYLGGASALSTQGTNLGVTTLTNILPAGLMAVEACLTLLANGGTAVGNAVLNVIYKDATGTLVTEAVTTVLNVAGALGSKARGRLQFSQNGTTVVAYSVTGVTTAGGLSYKCDVSVSQVS